MSIAISSLSADDAADHVAALGALLHACVHNGASIGFVLPFGAQQSEAYWRGKVLPRVRDGSVVLLAARMGDRIIGSSWITKRRPTSRTGQRCASCWSIPMAADRASERR